jgi:hypothetical protein
MVKYEEKSDIDKMSDRLDQDNIRSKWNDLNKRLGYKSFEFKVNVTKVIDYFKNRNKEKPNKEIYYEHLNPNCTVLPDRNHPYCPECGGKVVYKVVKT